MKAYFGQPEETGPGAVGRRLARHRRPRLLRRRRDRDHRPRQGPDHRQRPQHLAAGPGMDAEAESPALRSGDVAVFSVSGDGEEQVVALVQCRTSDPEARERVRGDVAAPCACATGWRSRWCWPRRTACRAPPRASSAARAPRPSTRRAPSPRTRRRFRPDMARPLAAVTGATGFLGRHLIGALREAGFEVRALARRDPASIDWLGEPPQAVAGALERRAGAGEAGRGRGGGRPRGGPGEGAQPP
ncbi:MAG: NAD-dependent epimerase/dehydratase family protein [Caulobacteraceae bacterium]